MRRDRDGSRIEADDDAWLPGRAAFKVELARLAASRVDPPMSRLAIAPDPAPPPSLLTE